ncbi:MAG: class I SAM-dependent methyltransferase [Methanomicrobiales archaeon]|nr:class I SAM-dependent methyltransferase [Methanomicrobiales archaeon]
MPVANAWEEAYARRGRLWGGQPDALPELAPSSSVLELGCGNGKNIPAMLHRGWQICALDISRTALALARTNTLPHHSIAWVRGDACTLPFCANVFDAVFASHIFGHFHRKARDTAAFEAWRVLKTGGRLFFRGFETSDMRCGEGSGVEDQTYLRAGGTITHYFTEEELYSLFHHFIPEQVRTRTWKMRIRGIDRVRAVVEGTFLRMD